MKDKMQASGFIEDFPIEESIIGAGGFIASLSIMRFFKKKDDLLKKVEDLEKSITAILARQERNTDDIKKLAYDITDKDGYVHTKMHDLINILNEKMMKDSIVDDIDRKMNEILRKLDK